MTEVIHKLQVSA